MEKPFLRHRHRFDNAKSHLLRHVACVCWCRSARNASRMILERGREARRRELEHVWQHFHLSFQHNFKVAWIFISTRFRSLRFEKWNISVGLFSINTFTCIFCVANKNPNPRASGCMCVRSFFPTFLMFALWFLLFQIFSFSLFCCCWFVRRRLSLFGLILSLLTGVHYCWQLNSDWKRKITLYFYRNT